jgi:hypothetical protein
VGESEDALLPEAICNTRADGAIDHDDYAKALDRLRERFGEGAVAALLGVALPLAAGRSHTMPITDSQVGLTEVRAV